jgi:CubicO group peptidase (beta-lactamase class C family)
MSSALDCDDNVDASPGNEDRLHEQANWTRWVVDLPTQATYRRDAGGRGPFAYCTANAFLLGQIVQRATHMPVDQYIDVKIFAPLGITKWEWPRSPAGEVMTGGGLRLRSRDIAALAVLIMQDGEWHGTSIVPASWIADTLTPHRIASPEQTYGYLSYQRHYATKCGHAEAGLLAGNGGSVAVLLKSFPAAIIVTRQNYNVRGTTQQTTELIEKIILPALPCGM